MRTAIVDYEMCNMFSVKQAADHAGLHAEITSDHEKIRQAVLVILPVLGAFGDAMRAIRRLRLDHVIREVAGKGKALLGICLGFQLFMSSSEEFGTHEGLDLISGRVKRFSQAKLPGMRQILRVPHIGWSPIWRPNQDSAANDKWKGTALEGTQNGEYFYFVHSFYVEPEDSADVLSWTDYGPHRFCSAMQKRNICAFQFHPEKSGPAGIKIYKNLIQIVKTIKR